jgi:hypothetical protein
MTCIQVDDAVIAVEPEQDGEGAYVGTRQNTAWVPDFSTRQAWVTAHNARVESASHDVEIMGTEY